MNEMNSQGTGFAIVMAIVLVLVIVYTVIKLRKQVSKAEDTEKKKSAGKRAPDDKTGKGSI